MGNGIQIACFAEIHRKKSRSQKRCTIKVGLLKQRFVAYASMKPGIAELGPAEISAKVGLIKACSIKIYS